MMKKDHAPRRESFINKKVLLGLLVVALVAASVSACGPGLPNYPKPPLTTPTAANYVYTPYPQTEIESLDIQTSNGASFYGPPIKLSYLYQTSITKISRQPPADDCKADAQYLESGRNTDLRVRVCSFFNDFAAKLGLSDQDSKQFIVNMAANTIILPQEMVDEVCAAEGCFQYQIDKIIVSPVNLSALSHEGGHRLVSNINNGVYVFEDNDGKQTCLVKTDSQLALITAINKNKSQQITFNSEFFAIVAEILTNGQSTYLYNSPNEIKSAMVGFTSQMRSNPKGNFLKALYESSRTNGGLASLQSLADALINLYSPQPISLLAPLNEALATEVRKTKGPEGDPTVMIPLPIDQVCTSTYFSTP